MKVKIAWALLSCWLPLCLTERESQAVNGSNTQLHTVFETSSPHNRNILVKQDSAKGVRFLTFKYSSSALKQSVVKLKHFRADLQVEPDYLEYDGQYVYKAMLAATAWLDHPPTKVLVAGLGGGTLPNFLNAHYPSTAIDIVEVDPKVVSVARDFMGFKQDAKGKIQVFVEDVRSFLELSSTSPPYDVIFLDCFGIAGKIPFQLTTQEFLVSAVARLASDGVLAMHVRVRGPSAATKRQSIVKTFQHATHTNGSNLFRHVYKLRLPEGGDAAHFGNFSEEQFVLIADPYTVPIKQQHLLQRAHKISTVRNYPFDLPAVVRLQDSVGASAFERVQAVVNSSDVVVRMDKDTPEQAEPVYVR